MNYVYVYTHKVRGEITNTMVFSSVKAAIIGLRSLHKTEGHRHRGVLGFFENLELQLICGRDHEQSYQSSQYLDEGLLHNLERLPVIDDCGHLGDNRGPSVGGGSR